MPSIIATPAELEARLDAAIAGVRAAVARRPGFAPLVEIAAQLDRLREAVRGGRRPPQALRDALDFGALASRHVHAAEPDLARDLYEIASWVAYA